MPEQFINNSDVTGASETYPSSGFTAQPQLAYVPQQAVSGTAYTQPVYAQPQPVYAQSQPTYVQQQPVYVQPQQAQTYVVQQPAVQQMQSSMTVNLRVVNRGPLPRNLNATGMQISLGIFVVSAFIAGCVGAVSVFGGYGEDSSVIDFANKSLSCLAAAWGFMYAIYAAIVLFGCRTDKPDWPAVSRLSLTALAFSLVVSVCLSIGLSQ